MHFKLSFVLFFIFTSEYSINANGMYNLFYFEKNLLILLSLITEPPILSKQQSFIDQSQGSSSVLTCNVIKGTKPFRFQWFKDGLELLNSNLLSHSRIESKDFWSLYTLNDIDLNDKGNYSCVVTNEFGFDKLWFQLSVTGNYFRSICYWRQNVALFLR